MGKITGFLEYDRQIPGNEKVESRLKHYNEFTLKLSKEELQNQGARCMDCGVPFCHTGCPLNNVIPEWNDAVYHDDFDTAATVLHSTNNFPEVTGRICPAPCEEACVLGINAPPVTIKNIEKNIADQAFALNLVKPILAEEKTGKKIAIVGSGPAGLASAQQLARVGHEVTVFEKNDRIGGLLRYGIPDFKMEKSIIDRRMEQMKIEGVNFKTGVEVGKDILAQDLKKDYDAVVLSMGAEAPRSLPNEIEGRDLPGVFYAMDFLRQNNKRVAGDEISSDQLIDAKDKVVLVIGGGDTGSDCVGTSNRQGAKKVYQFEIMPQPPEKRDGSTPWPMWSYKLRTSSSHEEGCERRWAISTKKITGNGKVEQVHAVEVELKKNSDGRVNFAEIPGSEFVIDVDLVLLAMGFLGPVQQGLLDDLGVKYNPRGAVQIDENRMTSVPGIFAAGDVSRGASLVVWALADGRKTAQAVDKFLMGKTELP